MKNLVFVLIGWLLCSCGASAQQDANADQFLALTGKANVQVLDVRTADEYKNGHIKNALQADWLNQSQFADRTQYLDKSNTILVYCASGGRSAKAASWLAQKGYTVVNLKGGFTGWKLENKPVEGMPDIKQLSMAEYKDYTSGALPVLIDFGAAWCPPCKKMEPVLASLQDELKGKFKLVKVDGGINTDVMKELNVAALPTFIIYRNGKEVWRKQGITDISEFKQQLQ
ncbi:MAG TPA: thioredoxin domain-containing protein [Panacibacter sp.]|nr:thioredoxin domain-containing protein [Panacibacter sp.]HNP44298.1 thioredoxin domain-containing protein [Panacibacter sp.]